MNRTYLVLGLVSLLLIDGAAFAAPPNVILVMSDDQGYGDFGAQGNAIIATPNIDAMARRSASMSTFYVSPVCSPTRASLMTGRYNYRTRCIDTWVGRSMMEPEEVTLAEVLREAGYATGIFGKWHLGDTYPMRAMDQGFEEALVLKGGGLAQPADPPENDMRYTNPELFHNGKQVHTTGYCTDVYFDAALGFIEKQSVSERPFFTYIATNAPHGPYHDVPEELRKEYAKKDLKSIMVSPPTNAKRLESELDRLSRIAAMITNIDQNMGRLFKHLDALNITDNTLVIFMVDNGPNSARFIDPFRGNKTQVVEGGVRSPFWAQWPARLKPGTVGTQLTAHIDVMPTILDACGVKQPSGVRIDGRSFLPLLEGKAVEWPSRTLALQAHRGDVPVRYHQFMIRDDRWKLLHPSGFGKESFDGEPKFELYDLIADPGEKRNLVNDEPEEFARLKTAYDAWFDDVSSTRPDNYAPPRIYVGTPHENPTVLTRQDWRGGTWERNSIGHWLVHVAADGKYDVLTRFEPNNEPGSVELRIGEIVQRTKIDAGATTCRFENVEILTGDTEVHAVIQHGDKPRGVWQVEVEKR